MESLIDLFRFLKATKAWWMAPVVIVLLLIGLLLFAAGGTAIAPFVYALF